MTLEKRVKALEGQAQQVTDDAQVIQGAALLRTKLDALAASTTPLPPCSPEEAEERAQDLLARFLALGGQP